MPLEALQIGESQIEYGAYQNKAVWFLCLIVITDLLGNCQVLILECCDDWPTDLKISFSQQENRPK